MLAHDPLGLLDRLSVVDLDPFELERHLLLVEGLSTFKVVLLIARHCGVRCETPGASIRWIRCLADRADLTGGSRLYQHRLIFRPLRLRRCGEANWLFDLIRAQLDDHRARLLSLGRRLLLRCLLTISIFDVVRLNL